MIAATPPLAVQSVVVYADAFIDSAWRNTTGVHAVLVTPSNGQQRVVWIPPARMLPVRYRGGAAAAAAALETWTDTDQAPLAAAPLFFNEVRSHVSVELLRTKAGLVLSWLKRRPSGESR